MDRGRRAEPYSNATIWTREIARNFAGHLSRVSKSQSCVDTKSPLSTRLPQFHHSHTQKRCPTTSPMKTRQPLMAISQNPKLNTSSSSEQDSDISGSSAREESDGTISSNHSSEVGEQYHDGKHELIATKANGIAQLETRSTNTDVEDNQDVSDIRIRIPAVKPPVKHHIGHMNGNVSEMTTNDTRLHHAHRTAHDYYKRQEQQKIWQENQALIKRLQSTKATLNFKQWEKDGKWAQEFLKTQERRRSALQHELRRAQASPHAVLRAKPLKSLHPHQLKNIRQEVSDRKLDVGYSPTNADVDAALSSRNSSRRSSNGQSALGRRGSSDVLVTQRNATSNRRVTEVRKKKTANAEGETTADQSTGAVLNPTISDTTAAFIPNNDIVTVRFTFSRGRSRDMDKNTRAIEPIAPLEVNPGDRGMMSLSGAFSPGVELEHALNSFPMADPDIDQPRPAQTTENISIITKVPANPHKDDIPLSSDTSALENVDQRYQADRNAKPIDPSVKPNVFPPPETEHTQSEDEIYDGNESFSRAPSESPEKHEVSGYASEFGEEPSQIKGATSALTNNQEESHEGEEEYSDDDFE